MDQKKKDKVKDFFRKEGFYLILFLCLCVIATVTVVVTNKNKALTESDQSDKEFTFNVDDKATSETQKQNADRVQEDKKEQVAGNEQSVANAEQKVAEEPNVNVSAGTTTEVRFNNPVQGVIARDYSYPKPQKMSDGTSRNIRGIDIKAEKGSEVKAAAIGEVKEVSNKVEDGYYIVVAHANGLYTKYSNLDSNIKVNVGDKVNESTVVGTVGESSKIFTNSEFGEHLNIQVQDSNGKDLNPTKYFSYNQ